MTDVPTAKNANEISKKKKTKQKETKTSRAHKDTHTHRTPIARIQVVRFAERTFTLENA